MYSYTAVLDADVYSVLWEPCTTRECMLSLIDADMSSLRRIIWLSVACKRLARLDLGEYVH